MRRIGLMALALLGACASQRHANVSESDESRSHREKGLALLASAESAPVPSEALASSLGELSKAVALAATPANRLAHARLALLVAPDDKEARKELASCLEDLPEDPSVLALSAEVGAIDGLNAQSTSDVDQSAERAEKAIALAAQAEREVKVFVGDQVYFAATCIQRRNPLRASKIVLAGADLGSPWALSDQAKLIWLSHGAAYDRKKALDAAEKGALATFSSEELARGLLYGVGAASRRAARQLGHMLVEEADFEKAYSWLDRGLAVKEDFFDSTGKPDPQTVVALAERGAIDALELGGHEGRKPRGLAELADAAELGFTPALVLQATIVKPEERAPLLAKARERGAPGAYALAGDFAGLVELASKEVAETKTDRDRFEAQRLLFFARAVEKGPDARAETEEEAHKPVAEVSRNTTAPLARQFLHVAGELPAEDLVKEMPVSAHVPRWRSEIEFALATRCLLLGDREGARGHVKNVVDALALFSVDYEVAFGAYFKLKGAR
jgi:hypothetical protein